MAEQWVKDLLFQLWSSGNGKKLQQLEKIILREHQGEMHELKREYGRLEKTKYLEIAQAEYDDLKENNLDQLAINCAGHTDASKAIRRFIFSKLRPGRTASPDNGGD